MVTIVIKEVDCGGLIRNVRCVRMQDVRCVSSCVSSKEIVLLAIARQRHCLAIFLLISETLALNWNERNVIVFRDKWAMAPTPLIWRWVAINLEAIWIRVSNPRISKVLSSDISLIKSFFDDSGAQGDLPPL